MESKESVEDKKLEYSSFDKAIEDSRDESFYGTLVFRIYKLSDVQIKEFDKKLAHLNTMFPESFRNPFSGTFVQKDFSVNRVSEDGGEYVFKSKGEDDDNSMPFFALKLKEDKKFNVRALKNDNSLYILTLLELLLSINPDSVKFESYSEKYDRSKIEILLAQILATYKEEL